MKSKTFLRTTLIFLVLALNIGCDQVSKSIVRHHMNYYSHIGYLNDHITISKVENSGAFLSLGDSLSGPSRTILLNALPLLAVLFGLYYILSRELNRYTLLGVIMVVGGGLGNVYDRIAHGSVTDFLYINFVIFQTGVFNIADVSIMIGVFLIALQAWLERKKDTVEPV